VMLSAAKTEFVAGTPTARKATHAVMFRNIFASP